ncbi:MAG TPA: methylated-DNA--[protein]-cysteine S-methyltransferase [Kiloniellales bacterium]|nr:methylated-DNA--[protein]-cysteine S-methyltransferase [Kiloniellales bacterium]
MSRTTIPSEASEPARATADPELRLVERACRALEADNGERVNLGALAAALGTTPWTLSRAFRRQLGVTPSAYAEERRARRFRSELRQGESVASATYGAGYGSSSRVYEGAARRFGMTPASYKRGGQGAEIAYAIANSPLGRLLVATTAQGVCFVALGEDDQVLEDELRREFPAAERIERDQARLRPSIQSVVDYLKGTAPHPELPLDVQSTAFQRRVWEELLAIPPGETRSYGEVAASLGIPTASRAVGRACATNPVALLIPCHRVTREDGGLSGYRWGMERKQRLLTAEAERG